MRINVIAMLLRLEILPNEANPQQMIVELILYGLSCAADFLGPDDLLVKLVRDLQRIRRNSDFKPADTHEIHSNPIKNDIKNKYQANMTIFLR